MKINTQTYIGIGFCIAYEDINNNKDFTKSDESIIILIPFLMIRIDFRRQYKQKSKKQNDKQQ